MSSWNLLDEKSEHELHKNRLLAVEERPFKRISKRLAAAPSLVATGTAADDDSGRITSSTAKQLEDDFALDFATFDSSLVRLQFLHDANERERERYRGDQERILQESQAARDTNAQLREHLEAARATLAQRKRFDDMANRITSNRLLRPRDEQVVNLAKLEEECRELERESEAYSVTWRERRDQFNRIMEEGMLLRRQIRDEKEEVDRREGMIEGDDDGAAGAAGAGTGTGTDHTPRPDNYDSPVPANGDTSGASSQPKGGDSAHLHPNDGGSASLSRSVSRPPSRDPSVPPREEGEDEDMADQKDSSQGPTGDRMDVDA
ncbi:Tho complex subunit 7 [Geosmithia morbida]|uniref:Tho complex subunit 7 n=1 Tax=Geosmithia morbida TaxID=1094350 RepID=A0A9P5D5N8_9HYPO|nr:Tho complex subunit 7 [Geosmithia morbida]KAF4123980.1 Tho complex subunit 7 [Geosmithia morbida]